MVGRGGRQPPFVAPSGSNDAVPDRPRRAARGARIHPSVHPLRPSGRGGPERAVRRVQSPRAGPALGHPGPWHRGPRDHCRGRRAHGAGAIHPRRHRSVRRLPRRRRAAGIGARRDPRRHQPGHARCSDDLPDSRGGAARRWGSPGRPDARHRRRRGTSLHDHGDSLRGVARRARRRVPVAVTSGSPSDDLAFAIQLAARAGRLLLDRSQRVERVDYKSAKDIVTEVDHLSEALIFEAIRREHPDDGLLGEETGEHRARGGASPTAGVGRVWIVDPLDGTINYANGIPFYCVSIALVEDGRPLVAVIHDPVRGETFAATAAGPATLDGESIATSGKEQLSDLVVSMALSGRNVNARSRAVRKAIRVSRSMGSAALALAYVGNGRFDAFVQQGGLSAWDIAAAGLIAERGGATVTDLAGGPWFDIARGPKSIGILAAPPRHHPELLRLIGP
ncbi:MAG: inositol monophosphatase [Chloroflexi bacterium]|nr:inositol monophosphatase [Chloroflexota bacterium]